MYSKTPKALFLCGSAQHILLFNPILEKLDGWNAVFYINSPKTDELDKIFYDLNLNHDYIPQQDMKSVKKFIFDTLKKENPNILITFHDQNPVPKLFIEISNSMSIPSLMVQDGLYNFNFKKDIHLKKRIHNRMKFLFNLPFGLFKFLINNNSLKYKFNTIYFELRYGKKGKQNIYGTGESTKIAVFGESTKEFLVSMGVNPNKIEVTGSPKFDSLYYKSQENKEKHNFKKVLILTQPLVEADIWTKNQREHFVKAIMDSIKNMSNIEVVFKLHPLENKANYEKILKSYKNFKILKSSPLVEVIQSSDLAITVFSTTGLEAMILKKPFFILNLFEDSRGPIFEDMNVVHVTDKKNIKKTIKTYLYDSKKIKNILDSYNNLYYHTSKIDGKSSIRIASLINRMINVDEKK